jgi:hypothetical protein
MEPRVLDSFFRVMNSFRKIIRFSGKGLETEVILATFGILVRFGQPSTNMSHSSLGIHFDIREKKRVNLLPFHDEKEVMVAA